MDLLPQFVGSTDSSMRCRYANRAYAEFLGRSPESMMGVDIRELWGKKLFEEVKPFLDRALAGEIVSFSKRIRHFNGEKRFGKVDLIPEKDGGYTVLIHDLDSVERHMKGQRAAHPRAPPPPGQQHIPDLESVLALESQSADSRTAAVLDSIKARVDALALSYELLSGGEPTGGWPASVVLERVIYSVGPGISASYSSAPISGSRTAASRPSSSSRRRSRVGRSRTAASPASRLGAFRKAWSWPSRTRSTPT